MNRTLVPNISHEYSFDLIQPKKTKLSNGIEIYYIEGGKQDVCRIDLLYKAGNIFESKNLLSSSTNDLLGEGTKTKSALEINEGFDFYGAYIQRESSRDYSGITLFTSDKHLTNILPLLSEVMLEADYSQSEFDIYLKNRKARFEDNLKKVEFVCRNKFTGYLYGDHPYGKPVELEHFNQITRDEVETWYQQHYKNQLPIVFVTGQLASRDQLEQSLEQLKGSEYSFPDTTFPSPLTGQHFEELPGAIQSAIRIGRPMITIEHPDYPALSVANTLLGGYFGSRLMKNIREEKGYTYGIGSGLVSFEKNGMWMIATEVGKDVTQNAIQEIYKEMDILSSEKVSSDELEVVKNYILGNFIKSIDGAFNQSEKIKNIVLRKLPDDFYQNQMKKILSVTPDDILKVTQTYFNRENIVELVVGGK